MTVCTHCKARHWECERTKSTGHFSTCCSQGKVQLPPSLRPNSDFQQLLEGSDSEAKAFRRSARMPGRTTTRCRSLRSLPTLTRLDQALKDPACFGYFVAFTIDSGTLGALIPAVNQRSTFAKTWLICPAEATDTQLGPDGADSRIQRSTLTKLDSMLGYGQRMGPAPLSNTWPGPTHPQPSYVEHGNGDAYLRFRHQHVRSWTARP
ncbi:BZ3500_MvSof-1268-A1-R1_Chr5-2g07838 [Microbotryum saponariae]|uniref:BZ3500_MvSof-1268-A1-R1_Chr5-2g07838 protein n=1 Tax=Microbotryum saponariae TaxID=289078 RepID=A0A2X0L167_9BASI|nr:BZ3500_MvSof-1268-A1-R1_Chr5-2g07838 [Microbotryum saponariae]SDA05707.1 BZ3501_MvSof-1269-A2-R1_Chr5-2g07660 [Microbotryum saponariae]